MKLESNEKEFRHLILFIFLFFILFRFFTILWFRPGGITSGYFDIQAYFEVAKLSAMNKYPFIDFWRMYPPVYLYISLVIYKLSNSIIPGFEFFAILTGIIHLLFEGFNFYFIYKISRKLYNDNKYSILKTLIFYSLLFIPVWTLWNTFDNIVLFWILSSYYFIMNDKIRLGSLCISLGILTKIIPVLLIPVILLYNKNLKKNLKFILYISVFLLISILPFILIKPKFFAAFILFTLNRPPWQTIWALLNNIYDVGRALPLVYYFWPKTYDYLSKTVDIVFPLWIPQIIFVGGMILYLIYLFRKKKHILRNNTIFLKFTTLMILWFLIFSKGYSPQFLIYLAVPLLLVYINNYKMLVVLMILQSINILECPVYSTYFYSYKNILFYSIIIRTFIWIYLVYKISKDIKTYAPPESIEQQV